MNVGKSGRQLEEDAVDKTGYKVTMVVASAVGFKLGYCGG